MILYLCTRFSGVASERELKRKAGLLIRLRFSVRYLKAFDLSAGYLAKLSLPAFTGLGYQEQNQRVPGLTELGLCDIRSSHEQDDRKLLILKLD
jgi:hypothetical protein